MIIRKKILPIVGLLLIFITHNYSQQVGINTQDPQSVLHVRADSNKINLRLDSKKTTNGFDFFTTELAPSGVMANPSLYCGLTPCESWSSYNVGNILNLDNSYISNDSIAFVSFFSYNLTEELAIGFQLSSSLPTGAIISEIQVKVDYDYIPSSISDYGMFTLEGLFGLGDKIRIEDTGGNLIVDFLQNTFLSGENQSLIFTDELESPIPLSSLSNALFIIPNLVTGNLQGKSSMGIDKVAMQVSYYVPVTGEKEVFWEVGADEGVLQVQSGTGQTPLSITENGTTVLQSLRLPNGGSNGYVFTSNKKGKGSWQPIPTDSDRDWSIIEDTINSLPLPIKTNEKVSLSRGATLGNVVDPIAGDIRFNASNGTFEGFTGAKWLPFTANNGWGNALGQEDEQFEKPGPDKETFGKEVGISGSHAVVAEDSSLYFFAYNTIDETWSQVDSIILTDKVFHIDMDGDYVVGSFKDRLEIYQRGIGNDWILVYTYNIPMVSVGHLVAIHGDRIAYVTNDNVFILLRNGMAWSLEDTLDHSSSFSASIVLNDDSVLVGYYSTGIVNGNVVYGNRNLSSWSVVDTLTAPGGPPNVSDRFGAVSIGGDWLAIGSGGFPTQGDDTGAIFMYKYNDNTDRWDYRLMIKPSRVENGTLFGSNVELSQTGKYLIASNYNFDEAIVFERTGNNWSEVSRMNASDYDEDYRFPTDIGITNSAIIIGTYPISILVNDKPGKVYFYSNMD